MPSRRATIAPVLLHRHARPSLLWPTLDRRSARMPADPSPLETSVSIVHIPVHLAQHYTNELYWTLERAKECEFFNLTANRIEVSQPWSSWSSSRSTGGDREARTAAACDRSLLLCRPPGGGVGSVRESTLPRRRAQLACSTPRHAARHGTHCTARRYRAALRGCRPGEFSSSQQRRLRHVSRRAVVGAHCVHAGPRAPVTRAHRAIGAIGSIARLPIPSRHADRRLPCSHRPN